MRTYGVEIAQNYSTYLCTAVNVVLYDFFINLLGVTVRTFSLFDRSKLGDRKILGIGLTVNRT